MGRGDRRGSFHYSLYIPFKMESRWETFIAYFQYVTVGNRKRGEGRVMGKDNSEITSPAHNQFCDDDWALYHGDGPRGMGPAGDGCVCDLAEYEPALARQHRRMRRKLRNALAAIIDYCHYVAGEIRNKDRSYTAFNSGEFATIPVSENLKETKGKSKRYAGKAKKSAPKASKRGTGINE